MESQELSGPEKYISLPLRFAGMDVHSAVGIIPVIIFPFAGFAWLLAFTSLVAVFIAGRFRLPSYQLYRYLRVRSGPPVLTPYRAQQYRDKRSTRKWPY